MKYFQQLNCLLQKQKIALKLTPHQLFICIRNGFTKVESLQFVKNTKGTRSSAASIKLKQFSCMVRARDSQYRLWSCKQVSDKHKKVVQDFNSNCDLHSFSQQFWVIKLDRKLIVKCEREHTQCHIKISLHPTYEYASKLNFYLLNLSISIKK